MASMTRPFSFLLSLMLCGAIAYAVSACADPQVTVCGTTGVLCPKGTHCAAAQGICLQDEKTCGDLHVDEDEVCDDGNNIDGDGCAADCRSTEACGNGKIDPGEECDDGKAPDGSSNNADDRDCRSDCVINRCGDGHPNTNGLLHKEACDAGAPV